MNIIKAMNFLVLLEGKVMQLLRATILVLFVMASLAISSVYAQGEQIRIKNKGGRLTVKDKSKPVRRELEVVFAERVQALKNKDVDTLLRQISPDYSATLPNGQTMNYEQIQNYIRSGVDQFVEIKDLTITLETIILNGNEAIVDARQHVSRKQRLRDSKVHDVISGVLQAETWIKTTEGWKLKKVSNLREQTLTVDGKPIDPSKPYNPSDPPYTPGRKEPKD
jgi:hypothetical protein